MSHPSRDRHSPALPSQAKPQHLPADKAEADPSPKGPFHRLSTPMGENADRLMDEVFGDIERLLERGAQLQPESPPIPDPSPQLSSSGLEFATSALTQTPPSPPVLSSSLALLPKLSPRQLTQEANRENAEAPSDEDPDWIDPNWTDSHLSSELAATENPQPENSPSLDQWAMGIACVALMLTAGLWVFGRYYLPKAPTVTNLPSAAEVLQTRQDAEFLNYVQRSMERIERAGEAVTSADSAPGSLPSALPPLYVPLPPPPTMSASAVPSPTARITVAPLPPVATAPISPASAPSLAAPAPAPAAVIPNIVPSPTHVLLGLLELGDRSAALFEISGAPQRIQVGEAIGSSGWALVSVSGEEAIVRRNGEVRSVYIGQKF